MPDTREPVPVYTVKNANQAEIIKNFLKGEGIACSIEGEGQIGLAGILDMAILVPAEDADRARKLIMEHERGAAADDDADEDVGEDDDYGEAE
jgi:hypothetical protein